MPELKHHFRSGKMNKDLDERLVPNGEYRDAQNMEISTSEGDDVGTMQNVRGTTRIKGKVYNSSSQTITSNWDVHSFGLTNAVCVGSVLNNDNDTIYWFITSDESDCIAEYDDIKGIISPVLIDTQNILNFSTSNHITGINIVEGMLLWTDNVSEPKKIDIDVFKSGCATNFTTHTTFHGVNFVESDITVAKKAPVSAPTLTMSTSTRGGNGTGTSPVIVSNSVQGLFANSDSEGLDAGTVVSLNFSPQPNFQVGDIITLTAVYEEASSQDTYEIKVRITGFANGTQTANCVLQSVPVEVPYVALVWEALLSEEGVLFEKKFVRFGYRWKYTSGEYSTFSPFSNIAFLPSEFEYLSSDGYNVGMINNLKQLTINITDTKPADVEEVDVLYKESNNNLVYVVDTLKKNSDETFPTTYNLESEIIGKTVESNQMLRPWDNVPRKARAQEVTANRLIYGNYLQQYNVPNINMPDISMALLQSPITTVKTPELSVKSLRTYQAGVVYVDAYNRQTPVFTSNSASKQASKTYAETVNSIQLTLNNTPPDWATHFKYYIKEVSNEYYNLAMDRYYLAEDGNVWLSFPSSERNKISEDSYLILKKQHDSDVFVGVEARYKVLDISNEAPDFIKLIKKSIGSAESKVHSTSIPQIGSTSFKFLGPDPTDNPSFAAAFTSDGLIQLAVGGQKTAKYDIVSGGYTGEKDNADFIYQTTIGEPLKTGETMLDNLADGDAITITLFEEKFKRKPEFYGRFFAKINRNSAFDTNIISTYPDVQAEYGIVNSRTIYDNSQNSGPGDGDQEASWYDTASAHPSKHITSTNNGHPKMGSSFMRIYWSGAPSQDKPNKKKHDKNNTINSFLKSISLAGTLFRMKGSSSNTTGEVYIVIGSTIDYQYRRRNRKKLGSTKRREYKIEFEHAVNLTPYEDSFTFGSDKIDEIQIIEKVIDSDNETITSDNPAVWETEPKEAIDLDLYYETGDTYPIAQHGTTHTIPFKNCYSFGNGVESNRIRDDYNAVQIDKGVKISSVLAEQYKEERRKNGLIYSGIFNSTSGINRLNQFIQGEKISKDINPYYGSIQKLHSRNTDLITFCEDKVIKILANKDALYNADGNANLTSTNRVLGQAVPFIGEFGISKNPESFASYAYRVYFADKNRGAILRLSRDGITAISENGMRDYFKDNLPASTLILGSYDDSKGLYNLTLDGKTVSFDEKVNGFPSFKSFIPEESQSLNNKYYTIKNGDLWVHTNEKRNRFYDVSAGENDVTKYYNSSATLLINDEADTVKGFKTINYSGSRSRVYINNYDAGNAYANPTSTNTTGWWCESIATDEQSGAIKEFIPKEGRWYNYIKGDTTTLSNLDSQEFSVQGVGQLTAISGDTSLADRTVTVSLTGVNGTTVPNSTFDVEVGTELHSVNSSITMTITPNNGYTLTAGDLSVAGGSTGSYVDSVSFAQSGVNVIATINFTDSVNMPSSDLAIALPVTGDGALVIYKLNDLTLKNNADSQVVVTKVYLGTSTATADPQASHTGFPSTYGTTSSVATVEFNLNSGYDFKEAPSYYIDSQDENKESEYVITYQDYNLANSAITIGVSGNTLQTVDKRIYTIQYKFPAQDTSDNIIIWDAYSVPEDASEDNKITGYSVSGLQNMGKYGGTKNVTVYGKADANFRFKNTTTSTASTSGSSTALTLSATNANIKTGMLVTGTGVSGTVTVSNINGVTITLSSAQTISSTTITFTEYWTGSAWTSTATTLTILSGGSKVIPITFYETSVARSYTITLEPVSPFTLLSPLQGNIYNNETQSFTGNGSTTQFTLTTANFAILPTAEEEFSITVDGEVQADTTYSYSSPNLTFSTAPTNLAAIVVTKSGVVQNPFTVNQYPDVTLTLGAASASNDFTVTSSNVVKTYTALGWPVETSSFFKADLSIVATATAAITKDRDPEIEDFTNYNSNNFDWDFELTSVLIGTNTVTITGSAIIEQYGISDTSSILALDSFLSKSGGTSGSSGQIAWTPEVEGSGGYIITAFGTYNDVVAPTFSRSNSKFIDIGVGVGTTIAGTGTIFGNFYGNTIQQITLSISATSESCIHQVTNLAVTKGSLTGSGSSQDLTYTWTAQFDEDIDSASDATFEIDVALFYEP